MGSYRPSQAETDAASGVRGVSIRGEAVRRDEATFDSQGTTCRAWIYWPAASEPAPLPCIVMAHGLGGTRRSALEPFALRSAAAGFAVLLFDYRFLGDSEGEPRQLISVPKQLEDWTAAIAFARATPAIDPDRIGLWGTSLSGGHVITIASEDPRIAAVSAQCPMLDGSASATIALQHASWTSVVAMSTAALIDTSRALLGLSPHYVPLVGRAGEVAAMVSDDAYEGCMTITPPDWRNEVAPRLFLTLPLYRPVNASHHIVCPTLLIACEQDKLVSNTAIETTAQHIGDNAQLVRLPIGHFDIYLGEWFERASTAQTAFFTGAMMGNLSAIVKG